MPKSNPKRSKRRALTDDELSHILAGLDLYVGMCSPLRSDEDRILKREIRLLAERLKRGHVTLEEEVKP